jgi:signal transduction histidine kinase/PAS domain-containing protein
MSYSAAKLFYKLTQPDSSIEDIGNQYQARLLAGLLISFIPLGLISILIQLFIVPGFEKIFPILLGAVFVLTVAYFLSRSKYYIFGAIITVLIPSAAIFLNLAVDPSPTISITFLILSVLLSSVLLTWRWTVILVIINLLITIAIILINPQMEIEKFAPSLGLVVISSGLILVFTQYRNSLEAQRQNELAISENRYRMLINQSPFSTVIYDGNGRTQYYNQSAINLWKLSEHDLKYIQENYNILDDPQLELTGIMPSIKAAFAGTTSMTSPTLYQFQRIVKSGGSLSDERWIVTHCYPVKDKSGNVLEVVLIHEDITENKRIEEEIDHRNRELTLLNRILTTATSIRNRDDILQFVCQELTITFDVSHAAAVIVNNTKKQLNVIATHFPQESTELKGQQFSIPSFEHDSTTFSPFKLNKPIAITDIRQVIIWPEVQPYLERLDITAVLLIPLIIRNKLIGLVGLGDKQPRTFSNQMMELASSVAAALSQAIQNAQLFEDAKHYTLELEERVAERTVEIEAANTKLQALAIVKDEFVSNVSHELRTPITNIKLFHDLLLLNPQKHEKYMATLLREIGRLEHIVESLLQITRLDQGSIRMSLSKVDLKEFAKTYVSDRMLQADNRNITLSFVDGPPPSVVECDRKRIEQVLGVLITNALNYTPSGGRVTVTTGTRSLHGQSWVSLVVQDTGSGIAPLEQKHLFERFFRGKAGQENNAPGTGLGLAIAKEIVERHNGEIEVVSEGVPGKGTTITVWLPVNNSHEATKK